jgi:hypothetical protein
LAAATGPTESATAPATPALQRATTN